MRIQSFSKYRVAAVEAGRRIDHVITDIKRQYVDNEYSIMIITYMLQQLVMQATLKQSLLIFKM